MLKLVQTACCAVGEIDDLSKEPTAIDALKSVYPLLKKGLEPRGHGGGWGSHKPVIVTFTGVTKRSVMDHASGRRDDYGQAFADLITYLGLGNVAHSGEAKNWTDNTVRLWTWTIDYKKLDQWADENGIKVAA